VLGFFFQAEDGIRVFHVTGVQTCALPIFETDPVTDITGARVLAKLGDSVTTDHISPAGSIMATSPAGEYLAANGIDRRNFNSYEIGRASCREREYIAVGWGTRNTKER